MLHSFGICSSYSEHFAFFAHAKVLFAQSVKMPFRGFQQAYKREKDGLRERLF